MASKVEERGRMPQLQSVLDYSSETSLSEDGKRKNKQQEEALGTSTLNSERIGSGEPRAAFPPMTNSVDLRNARSLTNGKKPNYHAFHSPAFSRTTPVKSKNTDFFGRFPHEDIRRPNDFNRQNSSDHDLQRWLNEVKPYLPPGQKFPWQERSSLRVPKKLVKRKLGRGTGSQSSDGDRESIEIISEGSRTITPQVEVVEFTEDRELPDPGNLTGKKVTFNPQATIRVANEAKFFNTVIERSGRRRSANLSDSQDLHKVDLPRRSQTDINIMKSWNNHHKCNKNKKRTEKEENDETNFNISYQSLPYNDGLHQHRPRQSIRCSCDLLQILRKHPNITEKILMSNHKAKGRSRSPQSINQLYNSWSFPVRCGSLDRHFSFTDHHLISTDSSEIRTWLQKKNKLLRKKKREDLKLERKLQKEENEREKEKTSRQLENQEKVRLWMKQRRKEFYLNQRKAQSQKRSSADEIYLNGCKAKGRRAVSCERSDRGDDLRMTKVNNASTERRQRAISAPGGVRQHCGKKTGSDDTAKRVEHFKRNAYQDWLKTSRENTASSVTLGKARQSTSPKMQKTTNWLEIDKEEEFNNTQSPNNSNARLELQDSDFQEQDHERYEESKDGRDSVNRSYGVANTEANSERSTEDIEKLSEKNYEKKSDISSAGKNSIKRTESKSGHSDSDDSDSENDDRMKRRINDSFEHNSRSRHSSGGSNDHNPQLRTYSPNQLLPNTEDKGEFHANKFHNKGEINNDSVREAISSSKSDHISERHSSPTNSAKVIDEKRHENFGRFSRASDRSKEEISIRNVTPTRTSSKQSSQSEEKQKAESQNEEHSYSQDSKHAKENIQNNSPRVSSHQENSSNTGRHREVLSRNSVQSKNDSRNMSPKRINSRESSARNSHLSKIDKEMEMNGQRESRNSDGHEDTEIPLTTEKNRVLSSRNSSHHSRHDSARVSSANRDRIDASRNSNQDDDNLKNSFHETKRGAASSYSNHESHHGSNTPSVNEERRNMESLNSYKSNYNGEKDMSPVDKRNKEISSRNSSHSSHKDRPGEHIGLVPTSQKIGNASSEDYNHSRQNDEDVVSFKKQNKDRSSDYHSIQNNKSGNILSYNSDHNSRQNIKGTSHLDEENRDAPSRNSDHNSHQNIKGTSHLDRENRDAPSRNSDHDSHQNIKGTSHLDRENRDAPSRNSDHDSHQNIKGTSHLDRENRDAPSRNSDHNSHQNIKGTSHLSGENRDAPSRNSDHNSHQNIKGTSHLSGENRDAPSRNSDHNSRQNIKDTSHLKGENRDAPSRNSDHNSHQNIKDTSHLNGENRDAPSRNSDHNSRQNIQDTSHLDRENRDAHSRNSDNNSHQNIKGTPHLGRENRDAPSRNSDHNSHQNIEETSHFENSYEHAPNSNFRHNSPFERTNNRTSSANSHITQNDKGMLSPTASEDRNANQKENMDVLVSAGAKKEDIKSKNYLSFQFDENELTLKNEERDSRNSDHIMHEGNTSTYHPSWSQSSVEQSTMKVKSRDMNN